MKKVLSVGAAAMLALALIVAGCNSSTTTTPPDPAKIANAIQVGTQSAVAIGFVAIPDAAQANQVATLAQQVLTENVLPILNGDNAGLVSGLDDLLSLKAFNDPKLAKAKLVLEAGLPILQAYLPADVAHTGNIPPDIKAYLIAFFQGASDGIAGYLGNSKAMRSAKDFSSYADLRAKLSAK